MPIELLFRTIKASVWFFRLLRAKIYVNDVSNGLDLLGHWYIFRQGRFFSKKGCNLDAVRGKFWRKWPSPQLWAILRKLILGILAYFWAVVVDNLSYQFRSTQLEWGKNDTAHYPIVLNNIITCFSKFAWNNHNQKWNLRPKGTQKSNQARTKFYWCINLPQMKQPSWNSDQTYTHYLT